MRDLSKYQTNYTDLPFERHQLRYRRKKILESLHKFAPGSILEIGCGKDPLFSYYKESSFFCVIEPGDVFYKNALQLAKGKKHISVFYGKVEDNIPTLSQYTYDFIVLSSLLHEVEDCSKLLSSVKKLCHKNTIVHINVPNAYSFHRILAVKMGIIKDVYQKSDMQVRMQQHHVFDMDSLLALLVNDGFYIMEKGTFFVKPFTHLQMDGMLSSGVIDEAVLDGLYAIEEYFPEYGSELFANVVVRG